MKQTGCGARLVQNLHDMGRYFYVYGALDRRQIGVGLLSDSGVHYMNPAGTDGVGGSYGWGGGCPILVGYAHKQSGRHP